MHNNPSSIGENYFEEYQLVNDLSDQNLEKSITNVKLKKKIMSAHIGRKIDRGKSQGQIKNLLKLASARQTNKIIKEE